MPGHDDHPTTAAISILTEAEMDKLAAQLSAGDELIAQAVATLAETLRDAGHSEEEIRQRLTEAVAELARGRPWARPRS
jgi:ABC-type transporter Mla subunit MlaD